MSPLKPDGTRPRGAIPGGPRRTRTSASVGTAGCFLVALIACSGEAGSRDASPASGEAARPAAVAPDTVPRFDLHLHLRSATAARLLEEPQDGAPAEAVTAADVLAAMDAAGVERGLVLSLAYRFGAPDLDLPDEEALVRAENDFVASEVAAHADRLVGACSVNPLAAYAIAEIERCLGELRFRVLKLHLTNSDVDLRSFDDLDRLREVFRVLERAGAGVLVHMRTRSETYGAEDARRFIDDVLAAAPGVPVEIAHMAGWGGYDEATDAALGEFARALGDGRLEPSRIWFGLAAVVFNPAAAGADTALATRVREANARLAGRIRELGTDRVTYGTDWPSWPPGGDPAQRIAGNVRLIRAVLGLTPEELGEVFDNPGLLGALPPAAPAGQPATPG